MGRRGPSPDHARREAFARLISEGVPSARASRMVGIDPRTGKRWRNGRRTTSGGRVLDLPPVITPVNERRHSPRYLSEDERVRLADLGREGRTVREAAALMGRSPSTIGRELRRGADASGRYRPSEAQRRALGRRRLRRPSRLARDQELRDWVAGRLLARWSPEQVSRGLRRAFPHQPERWLCAETIYRAVHSRTSVMPVTGPARRARASLRRRRWRRRRRRTLPGSSRGRPPRSGRTTEICFCDPRSPWQRPTNEHTNGMLRDCFPKGTDLSVHGAHHVAMVQAEPNGRPRRVLGWDTPAERLATLLETPSVLRR